MANTTCKEIKYNGAPVLTECAKRDSNGKIIANTYASKNHVHNEYLKFSETAGFHTLSGGESMTIDLGDDPVNGSVEICVEPHATTGETLTVWTSAGSVEFTLSNANSDHYMPVYVKQVGLLFFCVGEYEGKARTSYLHLTDDHWIKLELSGASSSDCKVYHQYIVNGYY